MQVVVLVSQVEWESLQAEVARIGATLEKLLSPPAPPDEVLSTAQAAAYIGLSTEALRRARRFGRIRGVRLNEKDWGFYRSALDAYPRRYSRPSTPPHSNPTDQLQS